MNTYILHLLYFFQFNLVFDNGVMPDVWIAGIIKLIYKNKGDNKNKKNRDNYRGISLLSCLGKRFTGFATATTNHSKAISLTASSFTPPPGSAPAIAHHSKAISLIRVSFHIIYLFISLALQVVAQARTNAVVYSPWCRS